MIKLAENTISQEELNSLSAWIQTNPQLTKGPVVRKFEEAFASYIGAKHCVMVNSGSSANLLMAYALLESNRLKNKKVVVPAVSWITTFSPFLQVGYEVLLCDCDRNTLGVDLGMLEDLFRKEQPALLILVHILGHLSDMDAVHALCEKYDVTLVEDACEALGTSYKGKKAGNLSLAGSFSFYYGHHISTIEGGAITTNDTELYNTMLSIRSHGWARDVDEQVQEQWQKAYEIDEIRAFYTFYFPGFNLRPTELNAYLGLSQLEQMDSIVSTRQANYNTYMDLLAGTYWSQQSVYDELSSFAYGMLVQNRIALFAHLKANNIECRPLVCGSMGRQPFFIKKFGVQHLPNADIVHDFGLYLPNHLFINQENIAFIAEKVKEVAIPYAF